MSTPVGNHKNDLLHYLIAHGDVGLYDCGRKDFPSALFTKKFGHVRVCAKTHKKKLFLPDHFSLSTYDRLSEIHHTEDEVCFLDRGALKALFIRLPVRPKYVLVRLRPRLGWVLGLLGLIRRVLKGQVVVLGVCKLPAGKKTRMWLVLKVANARMRSSFTLSEEVGVAGLLDYLRDNDAEYVVLRFFEKLPQLYREGGDLDILISDKDYELLMRFLERRRGSIKLDIWSVSGLQHSDTPYYPPPIARKILASSIPGPGGSKVPAPHELFLSFAYHALYHKGEGAGVPSTIPGFSVNENSENDYVGILRKMARDASIDVDITMEALDEYLHNEGWRPRIDSLARITGWNKWVKQRFFTKENVKEMGLGVFILKEETVRLGLLEPLLRAIKSEGFRVVRHKIFDEREQRHVADSLRGGNWTDGRGPGKEASFSPRAAIVVLDLHFVYTHSARAHSGPYDRITFLKTKMRDRFDKNFHKEKISLIHSTDNTNEAWEYTETCFPDEYASIKKEVDELYAKFQPSFLQKIRLHFRAMVYYKTMLITRIKESVITRLTK
jgi:hypothetical protein